MEVYTRGLHFHVISVPSFKQVLLILINFKKRKSVYKNNIHDNIVNVSNDFSKSLSAINGFINNLVNNDVNVNKLLVAL